MDNTVYYQSPNDNYDFGWGEMQYGQILRQTFIESLYKFELFVVFFADNIDAHMCVTVIHFYNKTSKKNIEYVFEKFPNIQEIVIHLENENYIPVNAIDCKYLKRLQIYDNHTTELKDYDKNFIVGDKMVIWSDQLIIPEHIIHVILPHNLYYLDKDDICALDMIPNHVEILQLSYYNFADYLYCGKHIPSNLKKIVFSGCLHEMPPKEDFDKIVQFFQNVNVQVVFDLLSR